MYEAYSDYQRMMHLAEEIVTRCALAVHGTLNIQYQVGTIAVYSCILFPSLIVEGVMMCLSERFLLTFWLDIRWMNLLLCQLGFYLLLSLPNMLKVSFMDNLSSSMVQSMMISSCSVIKQIRPDIVPLLE